MHIFKYLNQFLVTYGSLLPIARVKLLALYTKSEHWKKMTLLSTHSFCLNSLILNIHPSYPPPKYCGHQNPIPLCLFGTIITGSEVNRIYCVNFACSWAKQFVGLLITFFSSVLYSISSIIKALGCNISHLHYDWDNIRMQPRIHKFIILLQGLDTFFKY